MLLNKFLSKSRKTVSIFALSGLLLEGGGACPSQAMDDWDDFFFPLNPAPVYQIPGESQTPNPVSQLSSCPPFSLPEAQALRPFIPSFYPPVPQQNNSYQFGTIVETPTPIPEIPRPVVIPSPVQRPIEAFNDWGLPQSTTMTTTFPSLRSRSVNPPTEDASGKRMTAERLLNLGASKRKRSASPETQEKRQKTTEASFWDSPMNIPPPVYLASPLNRPPSALPLAMPVSSEELLFPTPKQALGVRFTQEQTNYSRYSVPYQGNGFGGPEIDQNPPLPPQIQQSNRITRTSTDSLSENDITPESMTSSMGLTREKADRKTMHAQQDAILNSMHAKQDAILNSLDTTQMTIKDIREKLNCSRGGAESACARLKKIYKRAHAEYNKWTQAHEDRIKYLLKNSLNDVPKSAFVRKIVEDFEKQGLDEISDDRIRNYLQRNNLY